MTAVAALAAYNGPRRRPPARRSLIFQQALDLIQELFDVSEARLPLLEFGKPTRGLLIGGLPRVLLERLLVANGVQLSQQLGILLLGLPQVHLQFRDPPLGLADPPLEFLIRGHQALNLPEALLSLLLCIAEQTVIPAFLDTPDSGDGQGTPQQDCRHGMRADRTHEVSQSYRSA
jgi:hypothetical protein